MHGHACVGRHHIGNARQVCLSNFFGGCEANQTRLGKNLIAKIEAQAAVA